MKNSLTRSTVHNDNACYGVDEAKSSTNVDNDVVEQRKKSRKRVRNVNTWLRVKRKLARQSGEQYLSANGNLVKAKKPCTDRCLCTCKLRCSEKFSVDERQQLYDIFYSMDGNAKNAYIFQCVKASSPKVRFCAATKHRAVTFTYFVTVGAEVRRVCKKAYTELHQVTSSKLAHIGKQVSLGFSAPRPDGRGKQKNRPHRCTNEEMARVAEHINMFPAEESHYSSNSNPNRKYLSSELNITRMHNLYNIWCTERNLKPVSARTYREILKTCFNLGFGNPKSNTCSTCDAGANEDHKMRAMEAFRAMEEDRKKATEDSNICYITFDIQKTLPLPKLSTIDALYLRQLWLYNVGIHLIQGKESRAYFNIWTEDEAGLGCEEVGSCILAFLQARKELGRQLIAWSDSCLDQNENFCMICLWQYLIATKQFDEIEHKFPEPGHSFMDSDRDIAHIEKQVKVRQTIYSVDEYHNIMAQSQTTHPPTVTRISTFYSLKELPAMLGLTNNLKNTEGQEVCFRDSVKWIRIKEFGVYEYKSSHGLDEQWHSVNIRDERYKRDEDMDFSTFHLNARPAQTVAVNSGKIADIQKQLEFIPPLYRSYYEQVIYKSHQQLMAAEQDAQQALCDFPAKRLAGSQFGAMK